MPDLSDMELVRDYDRQGSETAFAALVQRHVNLVYSVALRHVGIAAHAEEITQVVFVIFARKAASLRADTILEGWLHETTRLTALSFLRGERRRQFREQEAYMQSTVQESADASTWNQLAPLLDEALSRLGKKDRDAVMLRFFKEKSLGEVSAALNITEAAAQSRVHRAVEKLRRFFTKRGVVIPAAVLAAVISANSVQAAPVALAKSVTVAAIAKGTTASISTLTLIKETLKIMAWTKVKTAFTTAVILATITTGVVGYEMVEASNAKPPLVTVDWDIQVDGLIRARATFEGINSSTNMITTNTINTGMKIERFTDGAGRAVKYEKVPSTNGAPFTYTFVWEPAVPPGSRYSMVMEGTVDGAGTGAIKPTGQPNVFEFQTYEEMGEDVSIQRRDLYRLPLEAVLLEKSPVDLTIRTNGHQIELHLDKLLPPPGSLAVRFRYRLPAAAK